jgi:hypothetical protein
MRAHPHIVEQQLQLDTAAVQGKIGELALALEGYVDPYWIQAARRHPVGFGVITNNVEDNERS